MFTLDPYAARSCPLKTLHAVRPGVERPTAGQPTPGMPGSAEFVVQVLSQIQSGQARVADLRELSTAPYGEQETACLRAMASGVDVVISGLLPRDEAHHRRGRAELLIRDQQGGYAPGIVKFQRALDPRRDDKPFTYSRLADLPVRVTSTGWRYRWSWRWANAVHLAHLWHLLGACGYQGQSASVVVVGTERLPADGLVATWLDLNEATVSPSPAHLTAGDQQQVSTLHRYQQEFDDRVELARTALGQADLPETLLRPIVTTECHYCDWWSVCRPLLDDDDLSLRINKSPLDRFEITALRSTGVSTVTELAAADLDALLPQYLPLVAHRQGAEDRLRLAQRRSRLLTEGQELDRLTTGEIELPSAEIEVDIDVETSRNDRVYLWGFWISGPDGGHYQHFSSFSDLDEVGELQLAQQAMSWLRDFVAGRNVLLFHYSDYETTRLNRLAASGADALVWATQFAATGFVDLFGVVRKNFFGANGLGLKAVASAGAGFHWRDGSPGGLASMGWFDTAVHAEDPSERQLARERVLCYNEDDVRATAALRKWLRELR